MISNSDKLNRSITAESSVLTSGVTSWKKIDYDYTVPKSRPLAIATGSSSTNTLALYNSVSVGEELEYQVGSTLKRFTVPQVVTAVINPSYTPEDAIDWTDDAFTDWTGTDNCFACNSEGIIVVSYKASGTNRTTFVRVNGMTGEVISKSDAGADFSLSTLHYHIDGYIYASTDTTTTIPVYKFDVDGNLLASTSIGGLDGATINIAKGPYNDVLLYVCGTSGNAYSRTYILNPYNFTVTAQAQLNNSYRLYGCDFGSSPSGESTAMATHYTTAAVFVASEASVYPETAQLTTQRNIDDTFTSSAISGYYGVKVFFVDDDTYFVVGMNGNRFQYAGYKRSTTNSFVFSQIAGGVDLYLTGLTNTTQRAGHMYTRRVSPTSVELTMFDHNADKYVKCVFTSSTTTTAPTVTDSENTGIISQFDDSITQQYVQSYYLARFNGIADEEYSRVASGPLMGGYNTTLNRFTVYRINSEAYTLNMIPISESTTPTYATRAFVDAYFMVGDTDEEVQNFSKPISYDATQTSASSIVSYAPELNSFSESDTLVVNGTEHSISSMTKELQNRKGSATAVLNDFYTNSAQATNITWGCATSAYGLPNGDSVMFEMVNTSEHVQRVIRNAAGDETLRETFVDPGTGATGIIYYTAIYGKDDGDGYIALVVSATYVNVIHYGSDHAVVNSHSYARSLYTNLTSNPVSGSVYLGKDEVLVVTISYNNTSNNPHFFNSTGKTFRGSAFLGNTTYPMWWYYGPCREFGEVFNNGQNVIAKVWGASGFGTTNMVSMNIDREHEFISTNVVSNWSVTSSYYSHSVKELSDGNILRVYTVDNSGNYYYEIYDGRNMFTSVTSSATLPKLQVAQLFTGQANQSVIHVVPFGDNKFIMWAIGNEDIQQAWELTYDPETQTMSAGESDLFPAYAYASYIYANIHYGRDGYVHAMGFNEGSATTFNYYKIAVQDMYKTTINLSSSLPSAATGTDTMSAKRGTLTPATETKTITDTKVIYESSDIINASAKAKLKYGFVLSSNGAQVSEMNINTFIET
mgnify:CR=1 FL=1